jgi:hypothetical protein
MRKPAIFVLTCVLLAAGGAHAAHYSDTYVIPVVGHVRGANGTMWMSDLAIRNFGAQPLTVEMVLIESGVDVYNNIFPLVTDDLDGVVTVPANATVLLRDILGGYEKMTTGALILGGSAPFAVTSRAYTSELPLGQTVEPQSDFFESSLGTLDNTAFAYIPGVIQNGETRTNVGFVAGSGGSTMNMVVEIAVRNGAGTVAGTRRITIPNGAFAHLQFPLSSIVSSNFDVGSVDVRVVEGEGVVVPYASIVDNSRGEAAYVMGVFPKSEPSTRAAADSAGSPRGFFRRLLERRRP